MWKNFKHKAVRDLAWAIYSEGLLEDEIAINTLTLRKEYVKFKHHLKQLDRDPTSLIEFLQTNNVKRLGHYFEQLIFFWLQHSDRYMIFAKNKPLITEKKQTLGEVDLIVKDAIKNIYEHWELAVKYYLAYTTKGKTKYIGPNANDYFHLKLQKLKEHQCKILESHEGKKFLEELEITNIKPKLYVKGFLYYHPKQQHIPYENINPKHSKSWWIYLKEAEDFLEDNQEFAIVHKNQWLGTPDLPKDLLQKKKCIKCLHQELNKSPRSLYLACYKNSKLMSHGFVVHNKWPDIKS